MGAETLGQVVGSWRLDYIGLVSVVLGLAGWMLWALARRSNRRANAEGDLDTRSVRMVEVAIKPLQEALNRYDSLLEEERAEKKRAQEERANVTLELIRVSGDVRREYDMRLEKQEMKSTEAYNQLDLRMKKCDEDRQHQDRELHGVRQDKAEMLRRIERLEQGERDILKAQPAPGQAPTGMTIMPMVMPTAPVAVMPVSPAPADPGHATT